MDPERGKLHIGARYAKRLEQPLDINMLQTQAEECFGSFDRYPIQIYYITALK